jgi:thiol-disulfide isomerase/thioredoxin
MPERLPPVSEPTDDIPSAALGQAAVTTSADRTPGAHQVSRRRYLAGLSALAALGAAAVVTSRQLDAEHVVPSAHLAGAAVGPSGSATGTAAVPGTGAGTADLPIGPAAPAVHPVSWLNSGPISPQDLAGHVVLYYFWTFECINCQHVQPYIKAWNSRYRRDGLIVLSIHTPEFSVEADPGNVAKYLTRNGITYPVALDPQFGVWRAFGNRYWPARYLHDQRGRRRLLHIGEGGYPETEDAIRLLLGVASTTPRAPIAA